MKKTDILKQFYINKEIDYDNFVFFLLKLRFYLKLPEVLLKIQKIKLLDNPNIIIFLPTLTKNKNDKIYRHLMYKNIILVCIKKNDLYKENLNTLKEKTKVFGECLSKHINIINIKKMFKKSLDKTGTKYVKKNKNIDFSKQSLKEQQIKINQKLKQKNMVLINSGPFINKVGKIINKNKENYYLQIRVFKNKSINVWVHKQNIKHETL